MSKALRPAVLLSKSCEEMGERAPVQYVPGKKYIFSLLSLFDYTNVTVVITL